MSRPLRLELAGGLYHITSRGDLSDWRLYDEDIADCFNVQYSTVSRAIKKQKAKMLDCNT